MRTSEVLDRAADLIEERGWTQGGGGWFPESLPCDAPLCAEGALKAACVEAAALEGGHYTDFHYGRDWMKTGEQTGALRAVRNYLDDASPVFAWNDEPGRTGPEVIAVLRAAAVVEADRETATPFVAAVSA